MGSIKNKLAFYPALLAGKGLMVYYKRQGKERSDHAGMGAMRICPDFLKYVKKPPLTVIASGTNGKTTVTGMVAKLLTLQGMSVTYNDWGANHHAGHARCLLGAVNVFNHSTKDAAVVEMDELVSPINLPAIKPQYAIITNIGRDSMLGNAHPNYIREKMEKAAELSPDTFYIVNADNPLCVDIGKNNRRVFYGVADLKTEPRPSLTDDFPVCNICGTKPVYKYRNYRLIGDYECPCCGFKRPHCDYFVEKVNYEDHTITVREPKGTFIYPANSLFVHNIYNYVSVIAMFREMGMESDVLASYLKDVYPPKSRETTQKIGDITLKSVLCKGQNVSAASTVFEAVAREEGEKCLVLLLDEYFRDPKKSETIAWIFDTDYEYLNDPKIKQIIVGGQRYLDHRVRLLMAGIPAEKLTFVQDYHEVVKYVPTTGVDTVYVLHDVNFVTRGQQIRDEIKQKLLDAGRNEE